MVTHPSEQLELAEKHAAKLAREKSLLQLTIQLMNDVGTLPGLDNIIQSVLKSVVQAIGGESPALYYYVDGEIFYADLDGGKKAIPAIEDPLVRQAAETRLPVERENEIADAARACVPGISLDAGR